jgi:hypothetical protein
MPFSRGDLVETAPDQGPRFIEGYSAVVTAVEHLQGLELVSVRWTGTPPPGLRPNSTRCYAYRFRKVSPNMATVSKFKIGDMVRPNASGLREISVNADDTAQVSKVHSAGGAHYFKWLSGRLKGQELAYYDKNFDLAPAPAKEGFILLEMMDDKGVWHPVGTPKPAKDWDLLVDAGQEEHARLGRPFRVSALMVNYSLAIGPKKATKAKKAA